MYPGLSLPIKSNRAFYAIKMFEFLLLVIRLVFIANKSVKQFSGTQHRTPVLDTMRKGLRKREKSQLE